MDEEDLVLRERGARAPVAHPPVDGAFGSARREGEDEDERREAMEQRRTWRRPRYRNYDDWKLASPDDELPEEEPVEEEPEPIEMEDLDTMAGE